MCKSRKIVGDFTREHSFRGETSRRKLVPNQSPKKYPSFYEKGSVGRKQSYPTYKIVPRKASHDWGVAADGENLINFEGRKVFRTWKVHIPRNPQNWRRGRAKEIGLRMDFGKKYEKENPNGKGSSRGGKRGL